MGSALADAFDTYRSNLKLVLIFSIPFIVAFLIPLLAPLPTYISIGGIFLRSASTFINLSSTGVVVIVLSVFVSLLFLSFAFVAISLIVKSERTHVRVKGSVLKDIEKYTAKVFVVLLAYEFILIIASVLSYYTNYETLITALVGFFGFMLIFYAPSAIVVDNKRISRAIGDSIRLVFAEPVYFIQWLILLFVILSVIDLLAIVLTGTFASSYVVLIISSLFVSPYFVILQAESYMKRFPLLKH